MGATRSQLPDAFTVDHHCICLGHGQAVWDRAVEAIRQWKMFDLGWVKLSPPEAPIAEGTSVAVLVRHFGFWSLNAARIVYVLDEAAPVRRYGFAYGTLLDHAEKGEERFTVEWRLDGSVWYDLLAISRPNQLVARIAYPFTRRLQRRFARDSLEAMRAATQSAH